MGMEIPKQEKAKAALVNENGDILTLRRSQEEETRPGESDWPGGTRDEDETVMQALFREIEQEELPGTKLVRETILPIYAKTKIKDGVAVTTHLFAAVAKYPEGGIVLSSEHDLAEHRSPEDYPGLDIPNKYKTALVLGESVINYFAELQQNGQLEPEPVLLGQPH